VTDEAVARQVLKDVYAAIPHLLRMPSAKVWIDYDREADVLYPSLGRPQRATDAEFLHDEGVLLGYRGAELVGITILEASTRPGPRAHKERFEP
jgi:uncharacterized protein YuzE